MDALYSTKMVAIYIFFRMLPQLLRLDMLRFSLRLGELGPSNDRQVPYPDVFDKSISSIYRSTIESRIYFLQAYVK